MPSNRFASCSHLCCPAQILFLNAWQATDRREGSAPTQSSCLKRTQKKPQNGRTGRKPWPQEPLDRHKTCKSSFSTTWNHHTSWSQYLRRTGIGAHRFEYPEHAKELPSFISFGYQIHVMALFAHQNCLSSIAKSGSGVLLWLRQVAVPRRPARQFPVSARSTPSLQNKFNGKKKTLQYGWFCVSDLQDVDKNRMPKIIQNHLEFVWTGFSLRIYLFWIRSCCVCSFAMAITRNMGKFHKPKGCTATTGAFQRVCEKIPVTAAGWTKSKKHPTVTSFAWGIGSLRIDA